MNLIAASGHLEHEERTVFKYWLTLGDHPADIARQITIRMPEGSVPLHVGEQEGAIQLWVEVPTTPEEGYIDRGFIVYGTGQRQRTDICHAYIGTVPVGDLIWHVYETHEHTDEEVMMINLVNQFLGGE